MVDKNGKNIGYVASPEVRFQWKHQLRSHDSRSSIKRTQINESEFVWTEPETKPQIKQVWTCRCQTLQKWPECEQSSWKRSQDIGKVNWM